MLGLITGDGLCSPPDPYREALGDIQPIDGPAVISVDRMGEIKIGVDARHGASHSTPVHAVAPAAVAPAAVARHTSNYRVWIAAVKHLGATAILETEAAVAALANAGGDMVGLTRCPEAAPAVESAIAHASNALVLDQAVGVGTSTTSVGAVIAVIERRAPVVLRRVAAEESSRESA